MSEEKALTIEVKGSVAWVTMNRPDALNAWNEELVDGMFFGLQDLAERDEIGAIVITGAGRAFSSGADLRMERRLKPNGQADIETRLRTRGHPIITGIRRMGKPVIAAVNGAAAGVGCSLALACDYVIAAESAVFMLAFVRVGLMPDGGAPALVAARVGFTKAIEMSLLGDKLPAAEAVEIGLINRCVPDSSLASATEEIAERLAAGPPLAYVSMKQAFNDAVFPGLQHQLEWEATRQQELSESPDYAEGVAAFRERRAPKFTGGKA